MGIGHFDERAVLLISFLLSVHVRMCPYTFGMPKSLCGGLGPRGYCLGAEAIEETSHKGERMTAELLVVGEYSPKQKEIVLEAVAKGCKPEKSV